MLDHHMNFLHSYRGSSEVRLSRPVMSSLNSSGSPVSPTGDLHITSYRILLDWGCKGSNLGPFATKECTSEL